MSCTFSFYRNCGRGRDCSQERQRSNHKRYSSLRTADVFPVLASLPPKGEKRRPEIRLRFAGYHKRTYSLCKVPSPFVQAKSEAFIYSGKCYSF